MNPFRFLLLSSLLALASPAGAVMAPTAQPAARTQAFQAVALLGPASWSRVLRIENTRAQSHYPAVTYATVFEFGGILWFYCPLDGTQSLSLEFGRTERDKADLSRLLVAIDPGFARYTEEASPSDQAATPARGKLPNGCVIDSIAYGRSRLAAGLSTDDVHLLQVIMRGVAGAHSHMLLVFREGHAWKVFDPAAPGRLGTVSAREGTDASAALGCASEVAKWRGYSSPIVRARLWPFDQTLAETLRSSALVAVGRAPGSVSAR